ncbi:MAG: phospholipase D-like domain-containing protein [Persicimonas sp.]
MMQAPTARWASLIAPLALTVAFGCNSEEASNDEVLTTVDYHVADDQEAQTTRHDDLIADIDNARERVDVAVSALEDDQLALALVDAAKRGVPVRLVTDYEEFESDQEGLGIVEEADEIDVTIGDGTLGYLPEPTLAPILGECREEEEEQFIRCSQGQDSEQDVMVRPGDYNVMSHDFALIDDEIVWTFPPLDGASRDWMGWRVESSKMAYDFTREFQQMHGGVFSTTLDVYNGPVKSTADNNVRYYTDKGEMRLWFNPQERLLKQVIDEVYKAKASVWVMSDNVVNGDLLDALEYKDERGFDVRVMSNPDLQGEGDAADQLDGLGVAAPPEDIDRLSTLIVIDETRDRSGQHRPRRVLSLSHPLMRAKPFEVEFDSGGADDVIIYPSDLFVDGNLWQLVENGSAVHEDATIDDFADYFEQTWQDRQSWE